MDDHKQIGEAADRTGLSLRTIRYYEEVGLITPSARSHGGFRLYTESDIARLMVVKHMKPLGFSLEEMRDLLAVLDELERDDLDAAARVRAHERLGVFEAAADERCASLRSQLETAEEFARSLRRESQPARRHEGAGAGQ
ncbi:MerR family transcriptional regulator [Demequina sp. SO4-18]|uniref:MerR family transcriptional regulator n=1 Tax=Demequina sp. SO4-18 TaxID=3401026 RepID=UPI003B5C3AF7